MGKVRITRAQLRNMIRETLSSPIAEGVQDYQVGEWIGWMFGGRPVYDKYKITSVNPDGSLGLMAGPGSGMHNIKQITADQLAQAEKKNWIKKLPSPSHKPAQTGQTYKVDK